MRDLFEIAHGFFARIFPQGMDIFWQGWLVQACGAVKIYAQNCLQAPAE